MEWQSENPSSWIFKLRPNVKFSNGEAFDADAIVTSAEFLASPIGRSQTLGSTLYQVASAEAVDALTVRVKLNEPDPLFPLHAAVWRVVAPKLWRELGAERYAEKPIGTGPFVLEQMGNTNLVFTANKTSWHPAKLDKLTLMLLPDELSRVQALASGAADIAYLLNPESKSTIEQLGGTFQRRLSSNVYFLGFVSTAAKSPLKDPRVRRALNMAVDRQTIADTVMAKATAPASQLTHPGAFGFDPRLTPIPYDPAGAKKLLAEAGFANGLSLKMGVANGESIPLSAYQLVASDLAKIGVKLDLLSRPTLEQQLDLFNGRLNVDLFNMFTRGSDPIIDYRHRSCVNPVNERQPFNCDANIVAVVKQAMLEQDLTKRAALYGEVARLERDAPAGIVLWQQVEFDGLSPKVKSFTPSLDWVHPETWDMK